MMDASYCQIISRLKCVIIYYRKWTIIEGVSGDSTLSRSKFFSMEEVYETSL